jgi:hypothetical protein
LQCDIAKFFPTVDHEILLEILGRTIRDPRVMNLAKLILDTGIGILDEEAPRAFFPGDDLFAVLRPRGLPIGNLTSQFWANVYLNELDQFVKRELKVAAYLRYADDSLLFGEDKATLWARSDAVIEFLQTLRLLPNPKSFVVRPMRAGIDFLGFRVYPDHRRLLSHNVRAARHRLRLLGRLYSEGRITAERVRASVRAWIAHAKHADSWGLRRAVLREFRGKRVRRGRIANLRQDGPTADLAGRLHGEVPQIAAVQDGRNDNRGFRLAQ